MLITLSLCVLPFPVSCRGVVNPCDSLGINKQFFCFMKCHSIQASSSEITHAMDSTSKEALFLNGAYYAINS